MGGLALLERRPAWSLAAIVSISAAVRFAVAAQVHTPLYYPDEYVYSALARGIAHGTLGQPGDPAPLGFTISYLVPLLASPAWLLHNVDVSYRAAQAIGSVAFASSAIPVYLLARRVGTTTRGALFAAALSLLTTAGAFTATLLTEPYAFPLVLVGVLLAVDVLTRPTRSRIGVLLLLAIGMVFVGGLQLGIFLPACIAAYPLSARSGRAGVHRLVAATACAGVALALLLAARREPHIALAFEAARSLTHDIGGVAAWFGVTAFVLAIAASWVIIPGAALGLRSLMGISGTPRAFAALTVCLMGATLLEAAAWSARGQGIYERFVIYPIPLLAICFVVWLESIETKRTAYACIAYGMAVAAVLVPLASRLRVAADNSPTITGLSTLGPGSGTVVWAPLAALLAAALGLVGTRWRGGIALAAICVAVATSAAVSIAYIQAASHRQIPRVNTSRNAAFIVSPQDDTTPVMRSLFWNPKIGRIVVIGKGPKPGGFRSTRVRVTAEGNLVTKQGRTQVGGPFVIGPSTLVLGRSRPGGLPPGLASFTFSPSVIAFGWNRATGYLAPGVHLVAAGGVAGLRLTAVLTSTRGGKTMTLACAPGRSQRIAVGASPVRVAIDVPARSVRACDLRLVAGRVEEIDGQDASVQGTLNLAARAPS